MKYETTEKTIVVDAVTVNYHISGPLNDRLPLILIHDAGGSIEADFGFILPMMAYRQRVIALELAEPPTDRIDLAQFVAQVSAVIDAEVPEGPVSLLGYGIGAAIAAKAAYELSDKIGRLILVAGYMKADTHQKLRDHIWQGLYEAGSPLVAEFMILSGFSPFSMRAQSLEDVLSRAAKMEVTPFLAKKVELGARIDIVAECEAIKARTLVVGLSEDASSPRHHAKAMFGTIVNASYTEIATGHAVVHERPAELYYHVNRFCDDPDLYPIGKVVPAPKP